MATYLININERTALGKNLMGLLMSMPETVSIEKKKQDAVSKNKLYNSIQSGLQDVHDIIEGKQERKTLDELIYELRNNSD